MLLVPHYMYSIQQTRAEQHHIHHTHPPMYALVLRTPCSLVLHTTNLLGPHRCILGREHAVYLAHDVLSTLVLSPCVPNTTCCIVLGSTVYIDSVHHSLVTHDVEYLVLDTSMLL